MKKILLSFVLMIFLGITCFAYPSLSLRNKNILPGELINIMTFLRTAVGTQYELDLTGNTSLGGLSNFSFLNQDRNLKVLNLSGCNLESKRSEIEAQARANNIIVVL